MSKIICPNCRELVDTDVLDVRHRQRDNSVYRRRLCFSCNTKFTTEEVIVVIEEGMRKTKPGPRFVQFQNPLTKRYVKFDKKLGKIVSYHPRKGPYKNIVIEEK